MNYSIVLMTYPASAKKVLEKSALSITASIYKKVKSDTYKFSFSSEDFLVSLM